MAKMIIDIPEQMKNLIIGDKTIDWLDAAHIIDAISKGIVLDDVTNGEAIMTLFPDINVYEHGSTYSINNEYNFNSTWWNAPYKGDR